MVRKIFLLRHGEAMMPDYGMKDIERPLTSKGANQIRDLGKHLLKTNFKPDLVYCSSAERTQQTLAHLSESMNQEWETEIKREIYEAPVSSLFQVIRDSDNSIQTILLVGHNPGITYLVEYLSGDGIVGMIPGEMVHLDFAMGAWSEISQGSCSIVK
jgi:phosphohistidine phosphatase